MRHFLFGFLLIANSCFGQQGWEAEFMPGVSFYNGDLTQKAFTIQTIQPSISANLKYNTGDFLNFRFGLAWAIVSGNDKYNTQWDLKERNLNFKSKIFEVNACLELNLADPQVYYSYPYLFGGIGFFHFNPYSFDNEHKKVFLRPLSTEGEGLPQYPSRKEYSLNQVCLPFGGGWKIKINEDFTLSFELGFRYLFTDYLDDVSKTYVDQETLLSQRGQKAVEMAYRAAYSVIDGYPRGNPKVKDMYYFGGVKFTIPLNKGKEKKK
ncbi:MAG: hypothetical protein B6D37_00045 [Sphingobacteriales bacterium UTBCD1]|jgi:hypothetical protein|nr:MAG: hypothetical protein B6D37_00045 [Sphingobacteriales bacterium UTBCD1]